MVKAFESRGEYVSHILCGDFNIEPHFPAYQLLREGRLNDKEIRTLKSVDYIRFSPAVEPPSQVLVIIVVRVVNVKVFPRSTVITYFLRLALTPTSFATDCLSSRAWRLLPTFPALFVPVAHRLHVLSSLAPFTVTYVPALGNSHNNNYFAKHGTDSLFSRVCRRLQVLHAWI